MSLYDKAKIIDDINFYYLKLYLNQPNSLAKIKKCSSLKIKQTIGNEDMFKRQTW